MIRVRVEWQGTPARQQVKRLLVEGLTRAVVFLWTEIQETLNVPNTGVRKKHRTRKTKSGRPATYTVYPHPSKPGEAPRKRTGWLQRNVLYSIDPDAPSAAVGVQQNARYGAYLEVGTSRVKARPWLLATLERLKDQLAALIGGHRG